MKKNILLFALFALILQACSSDSIDPESGNKVLLLQVDFLTNEFEAGKELSFDSTLSFTVSHEYESPGDFGSIKILYEELNAPLFFGTIHWMGLGSRIFPETLLPKDSFEYVLTNDFVTPINGFENVFNPMSEPYSYDAPWAAIQGLRKVRSYLQSNPTATVKVFLYTPSVGDGDPADWDWIFFIKN